VVAAARKRKGGLSGPPFPVNRRSYFFLPAL
jgi:hypothetical protein